MSTRSFVLFARRIVTCDPARATETDPLGVIEDGGIAVEGGVIVDVGPREDVRARRGTLPVVSGEPASLVTPGLVDAHTHAPWVGSRDAEYALRLAGAGYEAIAAAGGGIVASMRAVRAASPDEIDRTLSARLRRMASLGVTTVEAKSGYGLDEAGETKQLEALERAAGRLDLPRVVPTFLALHAIPPEARADRAAYIEAVRERTLPAIAARRLARFVDVYVDRSAFSVDEARPVLSRAKMLGLGVRVHAGQFADVGGAELAAELGAASADHLEQVSPEGARALAAAGVRAVLLPVASFTLRQDPPPIAVLRAAGVRLVVASDANPGTAPTESLPLALALAARMYGLTVPEVILGATREAAASLGLADVVGVVRPDARADLVAWDLPHENALVQPWGVSRALFVLRDGAPIAGETPFSPG
ncbi:imidazolonepropionase [Polyangium jinanense]|uniref:Imidazolonepropionase n=1 Tax=Polyangium jinanense TaxID=2829994 RepID=A0A9X3X307_9BACT|nr:imidazolonepropionase [Polyangium jinanense]MDC3957381.1 imidazolonepropionase [Polyangium jinanense]MDC3982784.1 imidazolonepropionase [Polyangium jinanense]